MNKHIRALIVCIVVAFIGTLTYTLTNMKTTVYTFDISDKELSEMTYAEATKIMSEQSRSVTFAEYLESSIGNMWFWINTIKIWLAMLIISYVSFVIIERWHSN